jgi:uncharacterized protein
MAGTASPVISDVCLLVQDIARSVAFYRDRMGLPVKRLDQGFAEFQTEQVVLALWQRDNLADHVGFERARVAGTSCMVACRLPTAEAVDAMHADLAARGVAFASPPRLYPWNAYAAYFADPDEHLWELYSWIAPAREEPDF